MCFSDHRWSYSLIGRNSHSLLTQYHDFQHLVNMAAFLSNVRESLLHVSGRTKSADDYVELFNHKMVWIVNKHAQFKLSTQHCQQIGHNDHHQSNAHEALSGASLLNDWLTFWTAKWFHATQQQPGNLCVMCCSKAFIPFHMDNHCQGHDTCATCNFCRSTFLAQLKSGDFCCWISCYMCDICQVTKSAKW